MTGATVLAVLVVELVLVVTGAVGATTGGVCMADGETVEVLVSVVPVLEVLAPPNGRLHEARSPPTRSAKIARTIISYNNKKNKSPILSHSERE